MGNNDDCGWLFVIFHMKYAILYAYALVVVILVSALTFIVIKGIGVDWHGVLAGTSVIALVLVVASHNIIGVQKQLESLRNSLDDIEEYRVMEYKKRIKVLQIEGYKRNIEELESEIVILKEMLEE